MACRKGGRLGLDPAIAGQMMRHPFFMDLIPITVCTLVDWLLHHPVIWLMWEEGYSENGANVSAFP